MTTYEKLKEALDDGDIYDAKHYALLLKTELALARNTLLRVHRAMSGVMEYEGAWLNAPEKPEITPAKMVHDILSNDKPHGRANNGH